jgi:parvulin-like peptidyl-prolyl isomerase
MPPSPTPLPLAAIVNGSEITLAEYQAELALYRAASSKPPSAEEQQRVLNDLIDQALLSQAASEKGFVVDDALIQERTARLAEQLGSEQALAQWMVSYQYTEESFRRALARSIAAAWMRDQIIASVPKSAEQIHARQILLYNSDQANEVYALLQAGNNFGNLALQYDPVTGGDLGWFPRGFLLDPKLEEVAFGLQLDQFSPVTQTLAGYHILQVIERDPQRPLDPQALLILQAQAVEDWLIAQRTESEIQIMAP